jgi:hypothetical protein
MHALSDAFLYELNARGSILDQHHNGFVRFCLCANGPLQFGVIHTPFSREIRPRSVMWSSATTINKGFPSE